MDIVLFIIAMIVMLVGLMGIIIPILPGVPLIFGSLLIYALITEFQEISVNVIIVCAILTAIAIITDWLSATYGVKKMGGSYFGMIGAFVGMIVGLLVGALVGLIIGAFLGAFILELLAGKEKHVALRAGIGSFLGFLAGGVMKFVIGTVIIGVFVWRTLF